MSAAVDAFLEELAEKIATKVAAKLAAPSSHYGSSRNATQPPGKSRVWAVRNLRHVPGAKKVGRDWVVSIEDFEAWAAGRDGADRPGLAKGAPPANDVIDVDSLAEMALVESGYRRARARK